MNFAELRFWQWLVGGLVLILGARWAWARSGRLPPAYDRVALAVLSLALLAAVSWLTFAIYLTVLGTTYCGLAWIVRYHQRHALKYLVLLVPLQLAPLFAFKYADFVLNRALDLRFDSLRGLLIPVGISFYTFQLVGFVVDTLVHRQPLPRALDTLNFAGFFPQLVAGPIERRDDLLPQMERFQFRWRAGDVNEGAQWLAVGFFFKCCLADNLAAVFPVAPPDSAYLIWLANAVFGLRIYYDFAGYSLIAFGVGRCLGVRLTLNFLSPYCATSIVEFWRRWHVTLSQWFRDYLYVPLGGGRVPWWWVNVAAVFVVSGVWHGAGWNFVLWGALHGTFLISSRLVGKDRLPGPLAWVLTMVAVTFAWLCFYELDTPTLLAKLRTIVTPAAYSPESLRAALGSIPSGNLAFLAGLGGLVSATLVLEWFSVRHHAEAYRYLRRPWTLAVIVALTVWLAPTRNNGFIYFAF